MKHLAQLDRPALIDRLAERLVFERLAVELYEAAILRINASADVLVRRAAPTLARIRFEEHEHASWLERALAGAGASPSVETPRSALARIETEGIARVVRDARAPLGHVVQALLAAELVDHAGWHALLDLADEAEDDDAHEQLRRRLDEESTHLHAIRTIERALGRREFLGLETDVTRKAA